MIDLNKIMILVCFGTRAEWLKIKSILPHLDINNFKLFFTGQSKDLVDVAFPFMNINIQPSFNKKDRLNNIIAEILNQFPYDLNFDSILVQGDTASAFACALAGFHAKKKIYYVESGLRSYSLNHPYPEEGYRQMISRIADIHFCPTQTSFDNIKTEVTSGKAYITGNTVLDNIRDKKKKTKYGNKVLVTMHRRENLDMIQEWFYHLNETAKYFDDLEFIFPMHPNPDIQYYKDLLPYISVIDPLPHDKLIDILAECKFVITDSGGLQEEGSFLNKKVIVCRKRTERPEGLFSGHLIMCPDPLLLKRKAMQTYKDYNIKTTCPYGDGESGKRIAKIINDR